MSSVVLGAEADAALRRHAAAAYPNEACGVLVGRPGDVVDVVEATAGRNLVTGRPDRYELDPGDIVAAERAARAAGLDVVGFWHSHPDHPARPSRFDSERAWAEYVYVICAVEAGIPAAVRAFTQEREAGDLVEVAVRVAGAAPAEG